MITIITFLTLLGWTLGAAVIVLGVQRYLAHDSLPALLIALAVLIVGPVEDLLTSWVRQVLRLTPDPRLEVIDKATSAIFLALLFAAVLAL